MFFCANVYAADLDTLTIQVTQTTVYPGNQVTVNVEFGQNLGAYTFDFAYDSNLFEYVKAEGGTANDTKDKVRVYFYDTTGGTSPRENMSITFKAKEGITTSNPTDIAITAQGLANPDGSIVFDDIATPIIKNLMVEPKYEDYTIDFTYSGQVIKQEEKDIKLAIVSNMGRYYDHVRLIAEVSTPLGATIKLSGTDEAGLEHDIIQSGWGSASGFGIGGKVNKVLNLKGLFSDAGDYTINLKLIDRDNSDAVIATKTVKIQVQEQATVAPPENIPPQTEQTKPETKPETQKPTQTTQNTQKEPTKLPKTGQNVYWISGTILAIVSVAYFYINRKQQNRE